MQNSSTSVPSFVIPLSGPGRRGLCGLTSYHNFSRFECIGKKKTGAGTMGMQENIVEELDTRQVRVGSPLRINLAYPVSPPRID